MYYLIEAHGEPRWLRVRAERNGVKPTATVMWTNDAQLAMRFARSEDAMAFAHLHAEDCWMCRVTEHIDISGANPDHS
jgi:hypothetical protein